jgi:hypothetical protein
MGIHQLTDTTKTIMKRSIVIFLFLCAISISTAQNLGDVCYPGEEAQRLGITCQVTDDWQAIKSYIQNAKKGDVILSAGCGMIGGLLRELQPPQKYSHSGIMVTNYDSVRHSTSIEQRYQDYVIRDLVPDPDAGVGVVHFDPKILKYGWPGTITESIHDAFEGKTMVDPLGDRYNYKGAFLRDVLNDCAKDKAAIFPTVVKPFVSNEADEPSVRENLELIADQARTIGGHYRFYAYSNANILGALGNSGFETTSPDLGALWTFPNHTEGTVCSQLVWNAAKLAGVQVEDIAVESEDRIHPLDPGKRGLYVYQEDERRDAGEFIYNETYNLAYEESGWLGRIATDAPENLGNQICNCFAFDWCGDNEDRFFFTTSQDLLSEQGDGDVEDSDAWRTPGVGIALSPDDILNNWDRPPGGVYGHQEELEYRESRWVRVHRWARSQGTGDVIVNASFEGNPIEDISINIIGIMVEATQANGRASFVSVPAGRYEIQAHGSVRQSTNDGGVIRSFEVDLYGSGEVIVRAGTVETVDIVLSDSPPPDPNNTRFHRNVVVTGSIFIKDHDTFGPNEELTFEIDEAVVLDPIAKPTHTFHFEPCVDDEVRVELDLTVHLNDANISVLAVVESTLFEGTACDTNQNEDEATTYKLIQENDSDNFHVRLVNGTWSGDDESSISLTVKNHRQNP